MTRAVRGRAAAADDQRARARPTDGPIGDSTLLIDDGDVRVLNMNDSRPTDPDQLLPLGQARRALPPVLGRDLVPDGLRVPAAGEGGRSPTRSAWRSSRAPSATSRSWTRRSWSRWPDRRASSTTTCSRRTTRATTTRRTSSPTRRFPRAHPRAGPRGGRLMLPGTIATITPGPASRSRTRNSPETIFGAAKPAYLEAYRERKREVIAQEKSHWEGKPRVDLLAALGPWFEPLLEEADLIAAGINERVAARRRRRGHRHRLPDPQGPPPRSRRGRAALPVLHRPRRSSSTSSGSTSTTGSTSCSSRCASGASATGPYNDYVYTWFKCLTDERLQYAEGFYAEHGPTAGHVRARRLERPAALRAHEGRPARFGSIENGVHHLQPPQLAVGARDRAPPHLGRPQALRASRGRGGRSGAQARGRPSATHRESRLRVDRGGGGRRGRCGRVDSEREPGAA